MSLPCEARRKLLLSILKLTDLGDVGLKCLGESGAAGKVDWNKRSSCYFIIEYSNLLHLQCSIFAHFYPQQLNHLFCPYCEIFCENR